MMKYLIVLLVCISLQGFSQQTEICYLSGTDANHTVNWEFYCSDCMNSKNWTTIEVPFCWEQQGFGKYNYETS